MKLGSTEDNGEQLGSLRAVSVQKADALKQFLHLLCALWDEQRKPKTRRPWSLFSGELEFEVGKQEDK